MSAIAGHIDLYHTPAADQRERPLPWQLAGKSYTASGYGRKIPSRLQVRYQGRWRRVYVCIFSNSGTAYITAGQDWIVVF